MKTPRALLHRFVLAGLICLAAGPASAWLQEGHSIVAELAQRRVAHDAPDIAIKIQEILGPGVSMASIASWPDDYKWQGDEGQKTQRWHFVHIPITDDDYDPSKECVVDPKQGDCVIAELERLKSQLPQVHCTEGDERRKALMFAVHFVADVHQPLHTVAESEGGRKIDVKVSLHGARCPTCPVTTVSDNLSAAWNGTLINQTVWNWGKYVTRLENGWLKDHAVPGSGLDDGGPVQWALETHKVAQDIWKLTPESKILDDEYYKQVLPLLDQQLGLASLRLARFLEDALGSDACPATSPEID
jgi:nuclease S1